MINLERIDKNNKFIKIGIFISIFLFIVLILSLVLICVNVNDNNVFVLRIVAIILSILIGFTIIFFVTEFIYIKNIENKFLKVLKGAEPRNIDCTITEIDKVLTTKKYRKSLIVEGKSEGDKIILNFDLTYNKCNLVKGNRYIFETRNNYIISYKEVKDE